MAANFLMRRFLSNCVTVAKTIQPRMIPRPPLAQFTTTTSCCHRNRDCKSPLQKCKEKLQKLECALSKCKEKHRKCQCKLYECKQKLKCARKSNDYCECRPKRKKKKKKPKCPKKPICC